MTEPGLTGFVEPISKPVDQVSGERKETRNGVATATDVTNVHQLREIRIIYFVDMNKF